MSTEAAAQSKLFPEDATPPSLVTLEIIGEIGWEVDAVEIRKAIQAVDPEAPIEVALHSPGGSIFDSYLIHNSLKDHPGPVTVMILGLAASAGSWIPLAADPGGIRMHKLGQMLIHKGRMGAYDTADGLAKRVDLLRSLDRQMASLYAARTDGSLDDFLALMDEDKFMDAEEALALGLVDSLVEGDSPKNALDLASLSNVLDLPDAVKMFGSQGPSRKEPPEAVDPILEMMRGLIDLPPEDIAEPPPGILAAVGKAILNAQGATA